MRAVAQLQDMREWCLDADPGDIEVFSVGGDVSQTEASDFAGKINNAREGHVWISVEGKANAPETTTKIEVRCTN